MYKSHTFWVCRAFRLANLESITVAGMVWLLVAPPTFCIIMLVFVLIMTFVVWPMILFIVIKRGLKRGTSGADMAEIYEDEDILKLLELQNEMEEAEEKERNKGGKCGLCGSGSASDEPSGEPREMPSEESSELGPSDDQETQKRMSACKTLGAPVYCWVAFFFAVFHWFFILFSTLLTFAYYYLKTARKFVLRVFGVLAAAGSFFAETAINREVQMHEQAKAFEGLRVLSQRMTRCMDFIASRNENEHPWNQWYNRQKSGALDRLVAEEFKTEAERQEEAKADAMRIACEGVELAHTRSTNAMKIEKLWQQSAQLRRKKEDIPKTEEDERKDQEEIQEQEMEALRCVAIVAASHGL